MSKLFVVTAGSLCFPINAKGNLDALHRVFEFTKNYNPQHCREWNVVSEAGKITATNRNTNDKVTVEEYKKPRC